jgi:hypothetical protein
MFLRCTLRRQRVNRQYSTSAIPTLGKYLKRIGECDSGEGGANAFVSIDSSRASGVVTLAECDLRTSMQKGWFRLQLSQNP